MEQLTVNKASMARRIGELRAVGDSIGAAGASLQCGGDLGPGDINGALADLAEQWQQGLEKMNDKIGTMADNVRGSMDGYDQVEQAGREAFAAAVKTRMLNPETFQQTMDNPGARP